ncbi:MAG: DNA polymerase III subunit delta, partial [Muribaculaceae bacterium]|nr:DNA polymerase III subunit delta [Muribaculaceae bacterium]
PPSSIIYTDMVCLRVIQSFLLINYQNTMKMPPKAIKELSYRDVLDGIKKKNFSSIYLLMGEEPYYIDLIVDALETNVVKEENRAFDQLVYYGADSDIETIMASARQYPVMGDRQLVILKEAQTCPGSKAQLDKLASYVSHPNPNGVFVLAYKGDNLSSTSALMKTATKAGDSVTVFKSPKIRDYQLPGPIKDYCRQKKVAIDEGAVQILIEYIGNSLQKLFGEIDKLIVGAGPGTIRITAEMVEENIGISKEFNNFELTKAVSAKDYPKTLRILDYFRKNPKNNPTVMTTAILQRFFSQIVVAHFTTDKTDRGLMDVLQIKTPYALREIKDGLRMYTPRQSLAAISALRDFDCKSKGIGSLQNEYDLQRELIFKIFTVT